VTVAAERSGAGLGGAFASLLLPQIQEATMNSMEPPDIEGRTFGPPKRP
jgi:hypothetical protein